MKSKRLTFAQLPYLGGKLCMTTGEVSIYTNSYRRAFGPNVAIRRFTRTVKAGGATFECYVVIARHQPDTTGL
jgi:hypothetical protein